MKPHILLVGGSSAVRMDLRGALTTAGFVVSAYDSAAAATAALESRPYALAILEPLPPGMQGVELLRALRAHPTLARLPVIMLASEAEIAPRLRGLSRGADAYAPRPYACADVVRIARRLLGDVEPASEPPSSRAAPRSSGKGPPASGERASWGFDAAPPPSSNPSLFDQVVAVSGLSDVIARGTLERACRRAGAEPMSMTHADLVRALPMIREALSLYLTPTEVERRIYAILRASWPSHGTAEAPRHASGN